MGRARLRPELSPHWDEPGYTGHYPLAVHIAVNAATTLRIHLLGIDSSDFYEYYSF